MSRLKRNSHGLVTIFSKINVSSLLSVGRGVMESVDKSAEIFDLANIPKELYLFDDGGMAEWIGDEIPAAKKRKAMSAVTSRFGNKLTSELKTKGVHAEKHR